MSGKTKPVRAAVGVALLLGLGAGLLILRVLTGAGYFTTIAETGTGTCRARAGAVGAEDIVLDRDTGWLFLSSLDRRKLRAGDTSVRGEIFALNSENLDGPLLPVTRGEPALFHPHGIDLWTDPETGAKRLFVISHVPNSADRIEIFDIERGGEEGPLLIHRETVQDPLIHDANDIAAAGTSAFYVTNDHRFSGGIGRTLEDFLQLNLSDAVYFDGITATRAAKGLTYPNGIALNADGTRLYLSETTDGMLDTYMRDPETGSLTRAGLRQPRVHVGTGPDNITVDGDGRIWIAAHPKLFAFVAHAKDPAALSPTRVVRVDPGTEEKNAEIRKVYEDSGAQLSGGSVAVPAGRHLVMGSVFQDKILICDLPG